MKEKFNRALIVDGNSIINRAYYGIKEMNNAEGFPTNALFGFLNIFDGILTDIKPNYTIVCFDLKGGTFRNEMYAEYKAHRKSMDMELALQIPVLKEILQSMGYFILQLQGFEADDLIGTLSYSFAENRIDSYILTGDKDSLQLVGDGRFVCYHGTRNKLVYDEAKVFEDLGVMPNRVIDLKGLMGDSSDNIPGVKGVGKVTALKLLNQFDTVEEIIENSEKIESKRTRKLIEDESDMAVLSKKLATINCDVPIDFSLEKYERAQINASKISELCFKYELNVFAARHKIGKFESKESIEVNFMDCFKYISENSIENFDENIFDEMNDEILKYDFTMPVYFDLIKDDVDPLSKEFDYILI